MKRNSIKALGLSMMAGIAAMATTSTPHTNSGFNDSKQTVKRNHSNKNQSPESQRVSQESKPMQVTNERNRGYSKSSGWDMGIPPKTYGMHYVKRGTHKRTNKA